MTYLDRIADCNNADLTRYAPFRVADERRGWIRRDRLAVLAEYPDCLLTGPGGVALRDELRTFDQRTAQLATLTDALTARGEIAGHRGELYEVKAHFDDKAELALERAAVPYFGVRAWGIHVNGFVRQGDAISMWVARRSRDKVNYPGMLDNVVAGGQPMGLSPAENVIKECAEEASLPAEIAARAVPVGTVTYHHENETGLKPDCMFCYDLELPADLIPRAGDDEVESFHLLPIAEVAALVRDTREFKFNCNLVILDFLIRHGWLTPENEPAHAALVRGLRQ